MLDRHNRGRYTVIKGGFALELRVLQYFLTVAREESFSGAADALHLSQPTLSRQIKDMEDELGKQLLIRGRKITLTEQGMLLRKRAEEILALVEIARDEVTASEEELTGELHIGAGETEAVHFLTCAAQRMQAEHPQVHFHIVSGDTTDVTEQLERGLIDFGLLFDPVDLTRFEAIRLPVRDTWGILMRRDSPLTSKDAVRAEDLWDKPLIVSRHAAEGNVLSTWLRRDVTQLDIVGTYNLIFNASLMVRDGMGYALCLDGIINTTGESELCFRPLTPALQAGVSIIWKKYQMFTKAAQRYLQELQKLSETEQEGAS